MELPRVFQGLFDQFMSTLRIMGAYWWIEALLSTLLVRHLQLTVRSDHKQSHVRTSTRVRLQVMLLSVKVSRRQFRG